jgi:hypothetical protein
MSTLQQNWRKGQNRFCLEEGEKEGAGGRNAPNNVNKRIIKEKSSPMPPAGHLLWCGLKETGSFPESPT